MMDGEMGFIVKLDNNGGIAEVLPLAESDLEEKQVWAAIKRLLCPKACAQYRKEYETREGAG